MGLAALNLPGLITSVCVVPLAFFGTNKVCQVRELYSIRLDRIEKESWLRSQCADPKFYTNMRYHSNLCEEVEATARIGAFWYAVNEVAASLPVLDTLVALQRASWPFWVGLALLLILFPSLIIALVRAMSAPEVLPTTCRTAGCRV